MTYYGSIYVKIEAESQEAAELTLGLAVQGADVYGVVEARPGELELDEQQEG